jgi:ABC-type oligopeptide transport system substrate-binding subunit
MWHLVLGLDLKAITRPPSTEADARACDLRATTVHVDVADPLNFLMALGAELTEPVPEFTRHLDAARSEGDTLQREELLRRAEQVLLESNLIIPLWQDVLDILVKPRVKGWRSVDPFLPTRFLSLAD